MLERLVWLLCVGFLFSVMHHTRLLSLFSSLDFIICLLLVVYVCDTHASVSEGMSRGRQGGEKSEAALGSPFSPAVSFWGWTQVVRLVCPALLYTLFCVQLFA